MTLRDLYLRVSAAIDHLPPGVKAEIDAAFADHAAAQPPAVEQGSTSTDAQTEESGA